MSILAPEHFADFYHMVHGFDPFPWQVRLAEAACHGEWPRAVCLPTAAGKTGCIDIAVFALACAPEKNARRILFVVDRRVVVDQAHRHAAKLAGKLADAHEGTLLAVAKRLRDISGGGRALATFQMRGGVYRETSWTRSPLQATVISSTVDQVGSRLLFRGYGVSDSMRPIHAGLLGNDALILLDEAHCSKPFDQTVRAVEILRSVTGNHGNRFFRAISITATPSSELKEGEILTTDKDDSVHPVLGNRIRAPKPARLSQAGAAKGKKGREDLTKEIVKAAKALVSEYDNVGIIVNRLTTARAIHKSLGSDSVLLTGRMRPLDRDRLVNEKLSSIVSGAGGVPPRFVIGTQCLECGADFDFHALVTECASLDALRQRFGRLNRVASRESCKADIIITADDAEGKNPDPIYGKALSETWKWLNGVAVDHIVDFGSQAMAQLSAGADASALYAPAESAPVLFPSHMDAWVQTSPKPALDPDVAPFLHGDGARRKADVMVVIRDDLGQDPEKWAEIVSLCPPSSPEALSVPFHVFIEWLVGRDRPDESGDVEGTPEDELEINQIASRLALDWQGFEKSRIVASVEEIYPGRLFVVPCSADAIESLGDWPYDKTDLSEQAYCISRDKACVKLRDFRVDPESPDFDQQINEEINRRMGKGSPAWMEKALASVVRAGAREVLPSPSGGWVVTGKQRLHLHDPSWTEDTEPSESFRGRAVPLEEHSKGVAKFAGDYAAALGLDVATFTLAGLWHDAGKLDPRFQAMLKLLSPGVAAGIPLAKSLLAPRSGPEAEAARLIHRYPKGERHEVLSSFILENHVGGGELAIHLVATHHGDCRPFAPTVLEMDKVPIKTEMLFLEASLETIDCRPALPEWNAATANRFWRTVRKFGWWGTAFHEAVFRLADHAQSRSEQEESSILAPCSFPYLSMSRRQVQPATLLVLPGISGANPLGFLAGIGLFRFLERISRDNSTLAWIKPGLQMSWGAPGFPHSPVLHFSGENVPEAARFGSLLAEQLERSADNHPCQTVMELLKEAKPKDGSLTSGIRERYRFSPAKHGWDWVNALTNDSLPEESSQLQTVRRDNLHGNLSSILKNTGPEHLFRAIFQSWDYEDPLDNQSFHWDPSEDRRYAYQWNRPSGDPTKKFSGGMLGANRLAFEAWPLFPLFMVGRDARSRGFTGTTSRDTYWTWPLWRYPLGIDTIGSLLGIPELQAAKPDAESLRQAGITQAFRVQRILVGKTPNLTPAVALI